METDASGSRGAEFVLHFFLLLYTCLIFQLLLSLIRNGDVLYSLFSSLPLPLVLFVFYLFFVHFFKVLFRICTSFTYCAIKRVITNAWYIIGFGNSVDKNQFAITLFLRSVDPGIRMSLFLQLNQENIEQGV